MPHTAALLRAARRLCQDASLAEELVQEALLRAWRSFGRFQAGTNERAWLFRILINVSHERLRRGDFVKAAVPEDAAAPPNFAVAAEMNQALAQISLDHREVLLLSVVEGFTCQEIATILDIAPGTVMSRLSRGRDALRTHLAPAVSKGNNA